MSASITGRSRSGQDDPRTGSKGYTESSAPSGVAVRLGLLADSGTTTLAMVVTREFPLQTRGGYDVQDITDEVARGVKESKLAAGTVTIFCPGSTGGLTTIEYESGVVSDLQQVLDELTPPERPYRHHLRWGDDNGHSHIRAALVGPSLTVPFVNGKLTLGTWQQIVFCDFDTRPRARRLVVQIIGE